jgi:hypothetical protein
VGFNREVEVRGLRAPTWIRPGPLNLFVIGGDIAAALVDDPTIAAASVATDDLAFETFELLDFDAL